MPLRGANNPATDLAIMQVLQVILPPNTQLAAGGGTIYIQNRYGLSQGQFPAGHLSAGPQSRKRQSNHGYDGTTTINFDYYDKWSQQTETQDQILAGVDLDMERVVANLEENDALEYGGAIKTISLLNYTLSDYDGMFDTTLIPGLTLVKRRLTSTFNILPYYA